MRIRESLSAIHASIVAVAAVLVMALVGTVDILDSVREQRRNYTKLREQTVDTIEDALAQSVWHFDRTATRRILEGALTFDYIERLRVLRPDGTVYVEAQAPAPPERHWLGRLLFAHLAHSERPLVLALERRRGTELRALGQVTVTMDIDHVGQEFQGYLIQTVAERAAVVLILALFVTVFVRRMLTRPLNQLANQVSRLHPGDVKQKYLTVPKVHRDNEIGKVVTSFNDLLDRVQDSQRLREAVIRKEYSRQFLSQVKDRLEQEIADRTQELREEKQHAEMASRAKSIFLANMSHELRTPLNGVIGYAEMMKEEVMGPVDPPVYRGYVENIHSSGQHMQTLIDEVLSFSETEFQTIQLDEQPVELAEAIRKAMDTLRPQADRRDMNLFVVPPSESVILTADPGKLQQMLLNLIYNALKYTEKGGHVTAHIARDSNGGVTVSVVDTGQGIDPEKIEDVLEPFNRGSDPMLNEGGGLGLGLPLTKRIMEAHDGTLELQSEAGKGTTAILRFPAARVQTAASSA